VKRFKTFGALYGYMGLESFDSSSTGISEDTTVRELANHYGEEAVRRGLKYIDNLSEADEEYRKSADTENLKEGVKERFDAEGESEELDEASKRWAESMEGGGLGLSDE
jgi:hypothetical protein